MKDLESQFQAHASAIRVTPHTQTWERIEAKLLSQRSRRKLFAAKLLNIAAAVALVAVVSISVYIYTQNQRLSDARYSMSIEEIKTTMVDKESIYDVVRIRRVYAEYK